MTKRTTKKTNAIASSVKAEPATEPADIVPPIDRPKKKRAPKTKDRKKKVRKWTVVGLVLGSVTAACGFIPQAMQYDTAEDWLKAIGLGLCALAGGLHYLNSPDSPPEKK